MLHNLVNLKKKYLKDLKSQQITGFKFTHVEPQISELSIFIISRCLAVFKFHFLEPVITAIFKETTVNAQKANLKRAWFHDKELDIDDPIVYKDAIGTFHTSAVDNFEKYIPTMQKLKLYIQLVFSIDVKKGFKLTVTNNSRMLQEELARVNTRIEQAYQLEDIADAFTTFSDDTEGAGLGLLMNIMLLKNSGISRENFNMTSDDTSTKVTLLVPNVLSPPEKIKKILDEITQKIDALPTFPAVVNQVISLCDDPNSDFNKISKVMEKDPSLASGILTIANSAAYDTGMEVKTIAAATKKLGLKAIRLMAVSYSSKKILDKHYKIFEGFWAHSNRCAFYCKKLAAKCKLRKDAEAIYLGGLLHDLGKIVLYSIDKKTIKEINGMNVEKTTMNTAKLEEISLGISHAVVGARLARKWGFSNEHQEMILYHHSPFDASDEFKKHCAIIHIANYLTHIEEKKGRYLYLDVEAVKTLGIRNLKDLEKFHKNIKKEFDNR
jgi:putative nucleotidyltransferase with HDIG domain